MCADDDTTTEFSLLWLSDVKAGVYKVCGDLSVKRWEHEGFQRINQSEINKRLLTHLLEGKRPSKYMLINMPSKATENPAWSLHKASD